MAEKRKFAQDTEVTESKSRYEIESNLEKYGVDEYACKKTATESTVWFKKDGVAFMVTIAVSPDAKENRRRWRSLALLVKANLVAIDDNIVTFREAFMPYIVTNDGRSLYKVLSPKIDQASEESDSGFLALPGVQ